MIQKIYQNSLIVVSYLSQIFYFLFCGEIWLKITTNLMLSVLCSLIFTIYVYKGLFSWNGKDGRKLNHGLRTDVRVCFFEISSCRSAWFSVFAFCLHVTSLPTDNAFGMEPPISSPINFKIYILFPFLLLLLLLLIQMSLFLKDGEEGSYYLLMQQERLSLVQFWNQKMLEIPSISGFYFLFYFSNFLYFLYPHLLLYCPCINISKARKWKQTIVLGS